METTEQLKIYLPYILLFAGLIIGLLIWFSMRRGSSQEETKECAHCKGLVDADALSCRHCGRKVSN
jgi:hypothetical protein